jgi:hypothetical protein
MRRVTSACLQQTMRFDTSKEANPQEDLKKYLSKLDKNRTKYEVVDCQEENDGSLVVKIKKEYNNYSTEGYLK